MPVPERSPVLDQPFPPDDYLCTWYLPGPDGDTVAMNGMVELRASRHPFGRVYGEPPLIREMRDGQLVWTSGQPRYYPVVRATLANGAEMLLLDARVTWWTEQATVRAAAAALRKRGGIRLRRRPDSREADPNEEVTFNRMRFQVGALDAILGATPIGEKTSPRETDSDGTWTWAAKTNPATPAKWTGADDELIGAYAAKVNTHDFFNVSIRFAPALDVTTVPQTLVELVRRYLEPVQAIASIATGKSQPTTHLMLSRADDPTHIELTPEKEPDGRDDTDEAQEPTLRKLMPAWQIFGTGLRQAPYESDSETVHAHSSVLRCVDDGVDLLELIHVWWSLADEHHPLIETYAGMLHAQEEHPRSRFLLLIQSLEGLHGHATKDDYDKQKTVHRARRAATLERIQERVERDDFRFIKNSLTRDPFRSLETALKWSFTVCSAAPPIEERLARTHLVQLIALEESCSTLSALRKARNDLAHGTRGYEAEDLDAVNDILDRVVRAHALRLLGCGERVVGRLFG